MNELYAQIRGLLRDWGKSKIKTYSASVAFFSIFSTAPVLLLLVAAIGFFLEPTAVRSYIVSYLHTYTTPTVADQAFQIIENLSLVGGNTFAFWGSILIVYMGGTRVFMEIQEAFDHIWKQYDKKGVRVYIQRNLLGGLMIILTGILLVGSIVGNTVFRLARDVISINLPGIGMLYPSIEILLSVVMPYAILVAVYYYLPPIKPKLINVWIPALLSMSGMYVLKSLFTIFITYSTAASAYGAASVVVVLLLWFYLTAMIFLAGAKLVYEASQEQRKGWRSFFGK